MFDPATSSFNRALVSIKSVISWQMRLREMLSSSPPLDTVLSEECRDALMVVAPVSRDWKLFDHCASLNQIYAAYEDSVRKIITIYVSLISKIYKDYRNINDEVKIQYRLGTAHILQKWSHGKSVFSHIKEEGVASGLADGLRGLDYSMLPEAFLTDSDNYRVDTINRVFKKIGIENCFSYISRSKAVSMAVRNVFDGSETAESALNLFVQRRNEAAHGNVSDILDADQLLGIADYVYEVVRAMSSMLMSQVIRQAEVNGMATHVADVVHVFSNDIVGVRGVASGSIGVGNEVYVVGQGMTTQASVLSIKSIDEDIAEACMDVGAEFGLRLDQGVSNNSKIYILHID